MRKLPLFLLSVMPLVAADFPSVGVVNFSSCLTDSKRGKKEQEAMEALRNQMASLVQDTEKELKEIAGKFEDPEYLDSLSPKAEEEMKAKFQALQEDYSRYQNQFYQMLNQANYQMMQKVNGAISKAAERVAAEKHLDYVVNKDVCFYIHPRFDVTSAVVVEMDQTFELEQKTAQNEAPAQ